MHDVVGVGWCVCWGGGHSACLTVLGDVLTKASPCTML